MSRSKPSKQASRKKYGRRALVIRGEGKPGAVSLGANFEASERTFINTVFKAVEKMYPCKNPERRREEISMQIVLAAAQQLEIAVSMPHPETGNNNGVDKRQTLIKGTEPEEDSDADEIEDDIPDEAAKGNPSSGIPGILPPGISLEPLESNSDEGIVDSDESSLPLDETGT